MTGGTQPGDPDKVSMPDLGVGEMEGASFKVEPLRRTGEDSTTMRARLLCPSYAQAFRSYHPAAFSQVRPIDILTNRICRPKQEKRDTRVRSPALHFRVRESAYHDQATTARV
jgi:hypothetical protein